MESNQDSSFVQTWQGPHPQCYIPSPKATGLLVPDKIVLKGFTLYGHGGHLGHVTITICFKITPLNLWSLHMEFEFNLPSSFWEKCFPILIGLQYDPGLKIKGQP